MAFSSSRFTTFKNKWRGKEIYSIPGMSASPGQCTTGVREYIREVLLCKTNTLDWIAGGNAVDFFKNASSAHFTKIPNGPGNFPQEGDIVVASHSSRGPDGVMRNYGHVFIAVKGCTAYRLYGFGQNWTLLRKCDEEMHPHYIDTNWKVLGWLRAR
jgi:hypothetical protein